MAMPIRIGVCSWSVKPQNPRHLADLVRSAGLSAVQLALSPVIRDPETWAGVFDDLRAAGIAIASGMMDMAGEDYSSIDAIARTGGVRPDATWPDNESHAKAVADLAASQGIELVTFHAGFLPESPDHPERTKLLDRVGRLVDHFADRGVRVGLETGQESAAALRQVLDELDRPTLAVNFDPANMILYNSGDPIESLTELLDRVCQLHIKDARQSDRPGEWGDEVVVGLGSVDWSRLCDLLCTMPKPIDLIIEREAGEDRLADVMVAREVIQANLPGMNPANR